MKQSEVIEPTERHEMGITEDEYIDCLILALRKHGKIDLPMGGKFENSLKEIRQSISEISSPYYT
ncbi:MAG: hypothetical protein L3V56_05650 [Candidatus Magnetoovum sp. WYHC-5]|nr:hypothetical protein [Candidatus Magnetoovum sp. WYHC-5]